MSIKTPVSAPDRVTMHFPSNKDNKKAMNTYDKCWEKALKDTAREMEKKKLMILVKPTCMML
jgi:hypothetical protein